MSNKEIINIFNEDGDVIGTVPRYQAEQDNHITENVLVFVFNSHGKVWIQLRPQSKNHYPGMWDISACGGVLSSETHSQAAQRETKEEMGIQVKLNYVESFLNEFPGDNGEIRRRLSHLYIGISDEKPIANHEVDEFKLWDPADLIADIKVNPGSYTPSLLAELEIALKGLKELNK
jgi:isopentenyl-diphosphate delta-isomerase